MVFQHPQAWRDRHLSSLVAGPHDRYLAEFDFRHSTKNSTDAERSTAMLRGNVGKRLTYRWPAALAA